MVIRPIVSGNERSCDECCPIDEGRRVGKSKVGSLKVLRNIEACPYGKIGFHFNTVLSWVRVTGLHEFQGGMYYISCVKFGIYDLHRVERIQIVQCF